MSVTTHRRAPRTSARRALPASMRGSAAAAARLLYLHAPPSFGLELLVRVWAELTGPYDTTCWLGEHQDPEAAVKLAPAGVRGLIVWQVGATPTRQIAPVLARLRHDSAWVVVVIGERRPQADPLGRGAVILGPHQLCFAREDVAQRFAEAGIEASPGLVEAVHRETGGWPILVAAAERAYGPGSAADDPEPALRRARAEAQRHLTDWIGEEWATLVRYLAVAGHVSVRELDHLDPADSLREMVDAALVRSEPVDAESCVVLLGSVRQALLVELRARPADDLMRMHREIALLRESLGVLDCGLAAAFEAGDLRLSARILERWPLRFCLNRYSPLSEQVVRALPEALLREHPIIAHKAEYLGVLPLGSTTVPIPSTPAERQAAYRKGEDLAILQRSFYAMAARRDLGRSRQARAIAKRTAPLALLSLRADHGPASGFASLWFLHAGMACHLAGDFAGARHFYRAGWQYRWRDDFGFVAFDLTSKLALLSAFAGNGGEARDWLDQGALVPPLRQPPWPEERGMHRGAEIAELVVALDALDAEAMEGAVDVLGEYVGREELWPFVLWARAQHDLSRGAPRRVLELAEDTRQAFPHGMESDGIHRQLWNVVNAEARIARGQGTEALALLAMLPRDAVVGRTGEARLRLLSGDPAATRRLVADHLSREDTLARDKIELMLLDGVAADELGDREAAIDRLQAALRAAGPPHLRAFTTVPRGSLETLTSAVPGLGAVLTALDERGFGEVYPERFELVELSERERVVLAELARGGTMDEIAEVLYVSTNTVKSQARRIYAKLGVHSREEALATARRLGLLSSSGGLGGESR